MNYGFKAMIPMYDKELSEKPRNVVVKCMLIILKVILVFVSICIISIALTLLINFLAIITWKIFSVLFPGMV